MKDKDEAISLSQTIESVSYKYACPQCNKQFTQKGTLQKHEKSLHNGMKYSCP